MATLKHKRPTPSIDSDLTHKLVLALSQAADVLVQEGVLQRADWRSQPRRPWYLAVGAAQMVENRKARGMTDEQALAAVAQYLARDRVFQVIAGFLQQEILRKRMSEGAWNQALEAIRQVIEEEARKGASLEEARAALTQVLIPRITEARRGAAKKMLLAALKSHHRRETWDTVDLETARRYVRFGQTGRVINLTTVEGKRALQALARDKRHDFIIRLLPTAKAVLADLLKPEFMGLLHR